MLKYKQKLEEIEGKRMRIIEIENGRFRRFQQPALQKLIGELSTLCKVVELNIKEQGEIDIKAYQCGTKENENYGW